MYFWDSGVLYFTGFGVSSEDPLGPKLSSWLKEWEVVGDEGWSTGRKTLSEDRSDFRMSIKFQFEWEIEEM